MTTPQTALQLARQGDPKAIAHLINQALQSKQITARVTCNGACLRVMLESEQIPDQQILVPYLQKSLEKLKLQSIGTVELRGKQSCASAPAWSQRFDLATAIAQRVPAPSPTDTPVTNAPLSTRPQVLPSPKVSAVPTIPTMPTGVKAQKTYQAIAFGAIALIFILLGANLSSIPRLFTKAKPQPKASLQATQTGVYKAPIVQRNGGVPIIMVTFNRNQAFLMAVDTGASGTLITPAMASALNVARIGQVTAQTANGYATLDVGYVSSVEVDGASISNLPVAIGFPDMTFGLLGHDFFGNFDVTVREDVVEFRPRQ